MALCSITTEEPNAIDPLIEVAVMLHGMLKKIFRFNCFSPIFTLNLYLAVGILIALPDSCSKLQFSIAHLCETW